MSVVGTTKTMAQPAVRARQQSWKTRGKRKDSQAQLMADSSAMVSFKNRIEKPKS